MNEDNQNNLNNGQDTNGQVPNMQSQNQQNNFQQSPNPYQQHKYLPLYKQSLHKEFF